jgi:hypothetical protein
MENLVTVCPGMVEDAEDAAAIAKAADEETVPWEQVKRELDL